MSDWPDQFDVTWTSPSGDASGSMPLGNGDFGANVWVEPDGSLLLLLSKTDAWDENGNLLKLGRVRVRLSPSPFASAGGAFRQTLRLRDATIEITGAGAGGTAVVRVRIDACRPLLRVEVESEAPLEACAELELWRTHPYPIKTQTSDLFKNLVGKNTDPHPTIVRPDVVLSRHDHVAWCHHNGSPEPDGYEINLRLQGLEACIAATPHPLRGRAFGAVMRGDGFVPADDGRTLRAPAAERHVLEITALTQHPADSPEAWRDAAEALAAANARSIDPSPHERWWADFWSRSHVLIAPRAAEDAEEAFRLNRAYALQRFLNAAGGRGGQPIKHNGSIFSVGTPDDPDFRRWGPGYWFQNQRLIYWPMLPSGDLDLMRPWLAMYRDCRPMQRARTRRYFGHGGAHYPETIYFWGAEVSGHYGWTPFDQRATPEAECAYLRYYWSGGIELSLILLEYARQTEDAGFASEFLLPIAGAVLEFYDLHYPRDAGGTMRIEPSQALETWHAAANPTPEIAGLGYLSRRLIVALGEPWAARCDSGETRSILDRCRRILADLPPIPVGESDGRRVILPAERFDVKKNTENPELYCVFPYRLFGVGKPDLQLARDTLYARLHKVDTCWHQDAIHMAYLGLADEARRSLALRADDASHSDSRFPAFWNAFHDWVPDVDHGGVLQVAVHAMLVQCEGDEILLLPAWPAGWDVRFRLHAPRNTVVEAEVRGGAVVSLRVTPESRRRDVRVVLGGQSPVAVIS